MGRDPQGALAIDDAKMSRAHFEIVATGGEVFVRDLGSTGGVWLGAARLDQGRKARWPAHRMVLAGQSVFALLVPDALVGGPSPVADGEARAPAPTPASTSPPPSAAAGAPPGERDDEDASSSAENAAAHDSPRDAELGASSPIALVGRGRDGGAAAPVPDVRLRAAVLLFVAMCAVVVAALGYLLLS